MAPLILLIACTLGSNTLAVSGASPQLVCDENEASTLITVSGAGFGAVVSGALESPTVELPTVSLMRAGGLDGYGDGELTRTLVIDAGRGGLRWLDDETFTFEVSADLGLLSGVYDVLVTVGEATATLAGGLVIAGNPEVAEVVPGAICQQAGASGVSLRGEGLLRIDGLASSVTVGSVAYEATASGCVPLGGGADGEVCDTLDWSMAGEDHPLGLVEVVVTNPAPAACASTTPAVIALEPPPSVMSASPEALCAGGGAVTLTGSGFVDGIRAWVGGVEAVAAVVDAETLVLELPAGLDPGPQPISVATPDGCGDTLEEAVAILEAPEVFYADPPSFYAGLGFEVTLYLADVTGAVTGVWLTDDSDGAIALDYQWSPERPGSVLAAVPAELAAGSYGVSVSTSDGCDADGEALLILEGDLAIAIDGVDPAYAWTYDDTAVVITAVSPAPDGQEDFEDTPRVFLSREGGETTPLSGVTWRSPGQLTAVIPHSLSVGSYDVLAVNPSGALGLLVGGLTVTEEPPPQVDSVSPASLSSTRDEVVTIYGSDFREPAVSVACQQGGVITEGAGLVLDWASTWIEAELPSSDYDEAVCVVEVTNADGPAARWAAVSVRNPAQNLFPWLAGQDMVEARRAPAAVAGRTTSVSRYVYAIGGDDGDAAGASASVERASVGVYGEVGEWALLREALPIPTTYAQAARVGQFVYLVGGSDGVGAVDAVWRARILDPLAGPRLTELSIDGGGGLSAGTWRWRVSALFDASDAINPGGESLPGEVFSAALPDEEGAVVTLRWSPVDDAVGYRLYRSVEADAPTGEEGWLADVGAVAEFVDDGAAADAARRPLVEGALGAWAAMPPLTTPRQSPCLAVVNDPQLDPEIVYLFAAGGLDHTGERLDSLEALDIVVASEDAQTPGAWTVSAQVLSEARHQCGAYSVDERLHTVVEDGESWVYFAGGLGDRDRATGVVDAGRVSEGGGFEDWQTVGGMSPTRAGFGVASASDFLYAFGGQGGAPSSGGVSAELTPGDFPDFRNWNNLGTSMIEPRYLPGSAQESAVIFLIGGESGDGATRSTEVTNY